MGVMSMSCVMKTKIVPRDDVKTMPSITALHGPKGVLGNQEIGGGYPSASSRKCFAMTSETFFSAGEDAIPTLKRRDYKDPPIVAYETD